MVAKQRRKEEKEGKRAGHIFTSVDIREGRLNI